MRAFTDYAVLERGSSPNKSLPRGTITFSEKNANDKAVSHLAAATQPAGWIREALGPQRRMQATVLDHTHSSTVVVGHTATSLYGLHELHAGLPVVLLDPNPHSFDEPRGLRPVDVGLTNSRSGG